MEIRPLYQLPQLQPHQEWACEQGCSNIHKPKRTRFIYSESWDKQGNLIEEQAEYIYTCACEHLLIVWDNNTQDYATMPEFYYQEIKQ